MNHNIVPTNLTVDQWNKQTIVKWTQILGLIIDDSLIERRCDSTATAIDRSRDGYIAARLIWSIASWNSWIWTLIDQNQAMKRNDWHFYHRMIANNECNDRYDGHPSSEMRLWICDWMIQKWRVWFIDWDESHAFICLTELSISQCPVKQWIKEPVALTQNS